MHMHLVNQMLPVRRGEGCLVTYDFVTSFKAEKRKVNVGDVWFRVSPLSLSLSAGVLVCGCSFPFLWSGSTVEKFVFYRIFVFWIGSNWVFFVFYHERHGLAKKLCLFLFSDKFQRHFPTCWSYAQKPRFPFWRKSQHR